MNYFSEEWYTDRMEIQRNEPVKRGNLTTSELVTKYTDVPCHIYTTSKGAFTPSDTSGTVSENNSLACDIEVDLKKGDTVIVTRFGSGAIERYIAGKPVDKYEPFAGVSPGLEHKECVLTLKERT